MEKDEKKNKIMMFIVATYVVAIQPPKRRLTGTPHARANEDNLKKEDNLKNKDILKN